MASDDNGNRRGMQEKRKAKEKEYNSSIGNKQRTTQTGGTNQGGQREDNNKGEGSRDRTHERGRRGRGQ